MAKNRGTSTKVDKPIGYVEQQVITSERWTVTLFDFLSSLKLSVGIPVATYLMTCIGKGGIASIDWPTLGNIAAGSFLAYLIKKWTDAPKTVITASSNEQAKLTTNSIKESI